MWGGDASENDARFEETLEVVLKGLQCEFLSHSGSSTTSRICGWSCARISSRCPFWYAGNAAHAGERGMNFVGGSGCHGRRPGVDGAIRRRLQAVAAQGFAGRDEPLYGAIKRVYVAASDDAARERARLAYASYEPTS